MRLECNFTVHQERKTLDCYYELRGRQHFCLFMQLSPGVFMIIGGQLLATFLSLYAIIPWSILATFLSLYAIISRSILLNFFKHTFFDPPSPPLSISEMNSWDYLHAKNGITHTNRTTGSKVRGKCLEYVLVRNAAFWCARWHQKWIPEILYMRKMVSHAQNGLLGAKLEFNVLICVLVRIAASFCARRCQNWIPEILYMQKMVSHAQIGLQSPEIAQCLSQLPVLSCPRWLQCVERGQNSG